jgi:hypothetical protein
VGIDVIYNLINPETGKTYKDENLEKQHRIPIGALVEVKWDTWFGEGACWKVHARLWVVAHRRDCDGTPLYSISQWQDPGFAMPDRAFHGFDEKHLTPVEVTSNIATGEDVLEWDGSVDVKEDW